MSDSATMELMSLPPELRNRIYRFAVVSSQKIDVSSSGIQEPDLLLACKQTRKEALGIFYSENTFAVDNHDYDPSVSVRWTSKLRQMYRQHLIKEAPTCVFSTPSPQPNWPNFARWLKHAHAKETILSVGAFEGGTKWADELVLEACSRLAMETRDVPWERFEQVLEVQHQALIRLDVRWK